MSQCILFKANNGALSLHDVARTVDRAVKLFAFRGSTVCLPSPNDFSSVYVALSPMGDSDFLCERLIRHVAGDLDAVACDINGAPLFDDSDDNDLSFLDRIPAPEEELGSIYLHFHIDAIKALDPIAALHKFLTEKEIETTNESDGLAAYLALNGILDLFYDLDCKTIDGEIDTTFAGAGVYAEAFRLAYELADAVGGILTIREEDNVTYPSDLDFDKLSKLYYEALKQQLIFAIADDRDGLQAYIGWGVDTYEPAQIPGSVVTFLGRYQIDILLDEIREKGFSYMADTRLLVRNYPVRTADEYARTGISMLWTTTAFAPSIRTPEDADRNNLTLNNLDLALKNDPGIVFPINEYLTLCRLAGRTPLDTSKAIAYRSHYPIGYLREKIFYGFGSYLRKFALDGRLIARETLPGEMISISNYENPAFQLDCEIEYAETDVQPEDSFFDGFEEIKSLDIGGTAFCRYADGESDGAFTARAEILIKDERYTFILITPDEELLASFEESVSGCRAVEDLDDQPIPEDSDKPRAWGGCFFRRAPVKEFYDLIRALSAIGPLVQLNWLQTVLITFSEETVTPLMSQFGSHLYEAPGFVTPTVPTSRETLANQTAGKPLAPIAQINFAEAKFPEPFPEKGILTFYALSSDDPPDSFVSEEQTYFRLFYDPDPEETQNPSGIGKRMLFEDDVMEMTPNDYRFESTIAEPLARLTGSMSVEDLNAIYEKFYADGSRIGGYPVFYGDDPRGKLTDSYDCLLLQLDDESGEGLHPGFSPDGKGLLNFFIKSEDLKKCDFSHVLMVFGR